MLLMRIGLVTLACIAVRVPALEATEQPAGRPNLLWLTSEDHGPHLGCYGDRYARTPIADQLAAKGMIYTRVWSNAPVCAPARTTIISGLYPTATGSEHMRSLVPYPAGKKMFPQYLREAGYYCTNNAKEDYNLAKPGQVWDASSRQAHWKNRQPGQPFFAVFNSEKSHESRVRVRPHELRHDPKLVRIPLYHPDTPEVRQDWAQYHDVVSEADTDKKERLSELETSGLAGDTIIFCFADHGPGLPRSKRWPYNSGLHVPLIVYFPEKWRHLAPKDYQPGGKSDRLVSFVDLAPTMLSLAGIKPPEWMHGHAFAGQFIAPAPEYLHGFRGRMDERYDLVRSVTDGRYVYIRHYLPHLIYGQHVDYMFQTPTTRVWKGLHDEGKLTPAQDAFWKPKRPEELYDLQTDPDEVNNLAGSAEHRVVLECLRQAQLEQARRINDLGFLPEGERFRRAAGGSPMELASDSSRYDFKRVFAMAELTTMLGIEAPSQLRNGLRDRDTAIRWWAALGLLMRTKEVFHPAAEQVRNCLADSSPDVRVAAAELLIRHGTSDDQKRATTVLLELARWDRHDVFTVMGALNALEAAVDKGTLRAADLKDLPKTGKVPDQRYASYVPRLIEHLQTRTR